jgi:hypothetical protein
MLLCWSKKELCIVGADLLALVRGPYPNWPTLCLVRSCFSSGGEAKVAEGHVRTYDFGWS